MSDKALCETIGAFIRHHWLGQNKTQEAVDRAAGLSRSTRDINNIVARWPEFAEEVSVNRNLRDAILKTLISIGR